MFINENNNVLVYFYALWCIHCKEFTPVFESTAELLMNKLMNKIKFGKFDVGNNDV